MHYSIDRIIDDLAVLEDDNGDKMQIKMNLLPQGLNVGDCLCRDNLGNFVLDEKETQRRKNEVVALQDELFE